jgi:hypothetical protein
MKARWPAISAAMHGGYAKITWISPGVAREIVKTVAIAGEPHALSNLQSERPRARAENAERVPEDFWQGGMDKLIARAKEYEVVD